MIKTIKVNTILLPWESFIFLLSKERRERGGNEYNENAIKRIKRDFDQGYLINGMKQITDGDLGGCNGSPENAWEEGRWTSWTCEDMKKFLDSEGLRYKDGNPSEQVEISF